MVYGYAGLGTTVLLGAMGLPLPNGLATTVAGALAAQGRITLILAATVTVVASVLADIVDYVLGKLLGWTVLERHGRWFGFTPARHARAERLFEQWGLLTVFITRTFVSYLSTIVSVLAGAGHFGLPKFLAIATAGRVMWASAYLGLGYVIGGDLEAAAGFLANLSGLLISMTLLVAFGLIASGRIGALSQPVLR
jgi:membrane protein DedA with SNARE-associated domain